MIRAPFQVGIKKASDKPISAFDAALGFQQIAKIAGELLSLKNEYEQKLKEVDQRIEEAHTNQKKELSGLKIKFHTDALMVVDHQTRDILGARIGEIEMYLQRLNQTIADAKKIQKGDKGEQGIQGVPGKNAPIIDETQLVKKILKQIPLPKDGKDGSIDLTKFMDMVIEKLIKDKVLKPEHISGFREEMSSYRSQLAGKHYGTDTTVRGGGDTVAAGTGVTITNANGVKTINASSVATVYTETPTGLIDGANKTYTVLHSITTVFGFWINGEFIHDADYSVSGTTITFVTALPAALSGLPFTMKYA